MSKSYCNDGMWSHAVSCCCCSDRFHDGTPVVASRYRNVPMTNGLVVLHLRNVVPADAGLYTAIIKNNLGQCTTERNVVVDSKISDDAEEEMRDDRSNTGGGTGTKRKRTGNAADNGKG